MQVQKARQGYKLVKTFFGNYEEIPEGWEIKTFDESFNFLRTATNSRDDLEESGDVQYIHYGDIHAKWHAILDCDLEEIPYIDKNKIQGLPFLKDGDLVIADASEDYEGSGASVLLKNVKNRKIVSGLHTIALRNISENISSDFKTYLTSIKFVKNQVIAFVTGISVYGLSKNNLKKIRIPLPPLKEQQKIASILSNVDSLINQTQNEIEQTQRLKKGLMQRLLTKGIGNTEFVNTKLGKLVKFSSGEFLPENKQVQGNIPVYGGNGIMGWHNESLIDIPTIVIGRVGAYCGSIHFSSNKSWVTDNAIFTKSISDDIELNFLYRYLSRLNINLLAEVAAQPKISQSILNHIHIKFPKDKKIQRKIVSIISNIENHAHNQTKLKSKLETLKKGLIQKLLTGQIRVKI